MFSLTATAPHLDSTRCGPSQSWRYVRCRRKLTLRVAASQKVSPSRSFRRYAASGVMAVPRACVRYPRQSATSRN
jgi:hypothetical protein